MYLESFTHAKDPARQDLNEDRLVACGDSLFAVIDGVTDKSGLRFAGKSGGQLAGRIIEDTLRSLVDTGGLATLPATGIIEAINASFNDAYARFGLAQRIADEPNVRFGAQLALAHISGGSVRLLHVGDCGMRLNGAVMFHDQQQGDGVLAVLRSRVFAALRAAGTDLDESLAIARTCTVHGLNRLPERNGALGDRAWEVLRTDIHAELTRTFPGLPAQAVRATADSGLLYLAGLRNSQAPLGFACLDGTDVPERYINELTLPLSELDCLELYSDGYFGQPAETGRVVHWENHLATVESTDPYKTGQHASTKGSAPGSFTDDRTVLIIRKDAPQDARA